MPGRPITQQILKQIAAQGGFQRLCDRYASGETVVAMSKTFFRPDNHAPIDRSTLSNEIHRWCRKSPENQARWDAAEADHADARGERGVEVVADATLDKESITKAVAESVANFRYAGLRGPKRWGDQKQQINIQVNTAEVHLDALRHRQVNAPALAIEIPSGGNGVRAPETQELAVATVSRQHSDSSSGVQEVALREGKALEPGVSK